MARKDFSEMECSVARTLEVIGDRWTILVLRDAFYGVRRFDDFQRDLGIARNVLSDRLNKLVGEGVLERSRYEEKPPRHEYRLTEKGKELLPVILTMMRWGDRWEADESGPPVSLRHTTCGNVTRPVVTCEHCGGELHRRELLVYPLPILAPRSGARTVSL